MTAQPVALENLLIKFLQLTSIPVTLLFSQHRDHLTPVVDEMFAAILRRLRQTTHPTLMHSLLLVFIRLFHQDADNIAGYLASKHYTQSEGNDLEFVLRSWTQEHDAFEGAFKEKMSLTGLLVLFGSNNPMIANMMVRGDPLASPKRLTRSQTLNKTVPYSVEPIKLRIFKLIVRHHMVLIENAQKSVSISDSDEEDDLDDDSDEYDINDADAVQGLMDSYASQHTGLSLDHLLEEGDGSSEDEDDVDIRMDPIYNIDPLKHIESFLLAFASQHGDVFGKLLGTMSPAEQEHVKTHVFHQ